MYKAHAIFFYTLYIKQRIRYPYFSTGPTLEFSIWVGCHIHMGISALPLLALSFNYQPTRSVTFCSYLLGLWNINCFLHYIWKIVRNEWFSDAWYQTCFRRRQTIIQMRLSPVYHCTPNFPYFLVFSFILWKNSVYSSWKPIIAKSRV